MKNLILTLSLSLCSFALHAQGLNIQETSAMKKGVSTIELFKERKAERKAKRNHKKEERQKEKQDIVYAVLNREQ